uniref:Uncharacterized protein n=1 Tax=Dinoroseobacter phage vB_DshS_R26L TaxID=3161158 RepID=A0AAU7VFY0_9CAUD
MHLRIAHRLNGRTTIQSTDENSDYFELGARFDVIYQEKSIYLAKEPDGHHECREPGAYRAAGFSRAVSFCALEPWIPSFCVADAEFVIDDDLLVWERPPVWSLPWTTRAPQTRARDFAIHGLASRLKSARRNMIDPKRVTQAVPAWAKSSMLAGDWKDTVAKFFP